MSKPTIESGRVRNALWGLFVADALAMPAHWYYRLSNIVKDFDGGITEYVNPPYPHPEAFCGPPRTGAASYRCRPP